MNFTQALKDFEDFHQTLANRVYHYFGITLITMASLGLLDHLSIAGFNLAIVLLIATVVLDALVCPAYALPVLVVGGLLLLLSKLFGIPLLVVFFVLGWFCQLAGHRWGEKNKPAFLQNIVHLYVGPRWMLIQWLHFFGWLSPLGQHLRINTDVADVIRWLLARLMPTAGRWAHAQVQKKINSQAKQQVALRAEYHVEGVKVSTYTEVLRDNLISMQASMPGSVFIYTSGSTSRPKQIIYNHERLKIFKKASAMTALQTFQLLHVANPSMFIFASLQKDDSFASLVVTQAERMPALLEGIIEPAKFMFHPLLRQVLSIYGANAMRLWIICMSDPALLYATNPSTLAVFFQDLVDNWSSVRNIFQDFVKGEAGFATLHKNREWVRIIARLGRLRYGERMQLLAQSNHLPAFSRIAPSLKGYVCWDGGYVTAFLTQIHRFLPPATHYHVPMFSMSTETLQTQAFLDKGRFHFLPLAEHVLFEFFPETADPHTTPLLLSEQLEAGKSYVMVVSDRWGLRRYNTQDVFYCRTRIQGLPDLAFQKRLGLTYSFTGEKLTGEQVIEAIGLLEGEQTALAAQSIQYTLVPSQPDAALPHYVLILARVGGEQVSLNPESLSQAFDRLLGTINYEYRDKRQSQRLGPLQVYIGDYDHVARHLDPKTRNDDDVQNRSWESQFKLTPLTQILWQKIGLE